MSYGRETLHMTVAKTHERKPNRASLFQIFAYFMSADILLTKTSHRIQVRDRKYTWPAVEDFPFT